MVLIKLAFLTLKVLFQNKYVIKTAFILFFKYIVICLINLISVYYLLCCLKDYLRRFHQMLKITPALY